MFIQTGEHYLLKVIDNTEIILGLRSNYRTASNRVRIEQLCAVLLLTLELGC
jgi:hypothetical protein